MKTKRISMLVGGFIALGALFATTYLSNAAGADQKLFEENVGTLLTTTSVTCVPKSGYECTAPLTDDTKITFINFKEDKSAPGIEK